MQKARILSLLFFLSTLVHIQAQEYHLKNIKKLTSGGDNAEAYFSFDNQMLTLQITNPKAEVYCDQIFLKSLQNKDPLNLKRISTGKGRTTCSYFMPDNKHILFASTHHHNTECPPLAKPIAGKYVWPIYPDYDIFVADLNGKITKQLTNTPGYDAEAVVSPDGKKICFTSIRSGDLELWTMDLDGTNLRQVTNTIGYDGGAFFSHDSKRLIFRASRPKTEDEINLYKSLLAKNLVMPTNMELFMCNVDGTNLKQITKLGKANWAPYLHPNDKTIIFASNHHSTRGYDFQLYTIDTNGQNLKQITYQSNFNAFAMFSYDGKKLVFSSNRDQTVEGETNTFLADWVEIPEDQNPDASKLHELVYTLSDDKMEGRLAGSPAEDIAAAYLVDEFRKRELKTVLGNSYLHPFEYKIRTNPHDTTTKSSLSIKAKNIIGFIDNKAPKTIVLGAHYDHLGRNERNQSTLKNSKGQIHNGADDNASGVSALLEVARLLQNNQIQEKTNFICIAFSGEEDGLMGSKEAIKLLKDQYNITAMINMDMVGKLDSMKNLHISGIGTSPLFPALIQKLKPAGFNLTIDSSGQGPSDHTSFYNQGVSVLNFFTGVHHDYHKPSDDAEKINFEGLKLITQYIYHTARELSDLDSIPFTKTRNIQSKSVPKYKVTLGIMPDYTDRGDGLHVEGVTEDRPAHAAGIKEGDILLQIGDCSFKEIYGYMECLSKFSAGEETTIVFLRGGKKETVKVKF